MSRGFPAFFKQFWLHFRKNFRKNLKINRKWIYKWWLLPVIVYNSHWWSVCPCWLVCQNKSGKLWPRFIAIQMSKNSLTMSTWQSLWSFPEYRSTPFNWYVYDVWNRHINDIYVHALCFMFLFPCLSSACSPCNEQDETCMTVVT